MKSENIMLVVLGAICKVAVAIAAVFLIWQGATKCYDYGYRVFTEPAIAAGEGRTVTVTVPVDTNALELGELMESKGLTRDKYLFAMQYLLSEYREDFQPGTYELSTSMTAEEMMAVMSPSDETEEESEETASSSATAASSAASEQ